MVRAETLGFEDRNTSNMVHFDHFPQSIFCTVTAAVTR